jgi:predicted RNA binding protein with dsRBD fold (UPF0201 family)
MILEVRAEAEVRSTEDQTKVERALLKLFPSGRIQKDVKSDGAIFVSVHGSGFDFLSNLRSLIKQERIRTAARAILLRKLREPPLRIYLNKQAAFMGRVSFCEPEGESPHGPVAILIDSTDYQQVIDYLASPIKPTLEGESRQGRRR